MPLILAIILLAALLANQLPSQQQHPEDLVDPPPALLQRGLLRPAAFAPPAPALLLELEEEGLIAAARGIFLAPLDARAWHVLRDFHACLAHD